MKFLCSPRISWLFFGGMVIGIEVIRQYPGQRMVMVGGLVFFLVCVLVDWLLQVSAAEEEKQRLQRDAHMRQLAEEEAEDDPGLLEQLESLQRAVQEQDQELDELKLDLQIAVAERQKAEEEREDIRQILNYNRTQYRAEQLESQDLRERLAAKGEIQ